MSTAAKMPTRGAATTPQLSRRALNALNKGAMVELWVECDPFTCQEGDIEKVEKQNIFCSIHKTLIQHFSGKLKRELTGNPAKRVHIPFFREPVKFVVDWMKNGGTDQLGTAASPYPKGIEDLKIVKDLVVYLEVDQLIERIAKDIEAITPILPAPKKDIAPRKKPIQVERLCYYCSKPGHIKRDCREWIERNAIFVTKSNAETYALDGSRQVVNSNSPKKLKVEPVAGRGAERGAAMKATSPAVQSNGMHPKALTLHDRDLTHFGPESRNRKLRPVSGEIVAFDEAGTRWVVEWNRVEIEVVGPVISTICKITGTATSW